MAARIAFIFSIISSISLLPRMTAQNASAQAAADQALRARVSEFLQLHVDGNFRKAYDMVAEDTKDEYFGSGKARLQAFKIDDVKFTDSSFTKAAVTATMTKMVNVGGQDIPLASPSTTTWKIESGKWVWYNDVKQSSITALGIPSGPAAKIEDTAPGGLPKDLNDQTIAAAARSILQQVSVNKQEITLAADKASEDTVIFHNGMPGSVQLELTTPDVPGFTAKLEQTMVRGAGDVPLVFRYQPGARAERRDPVNVQVTVQPLNQVFVIRVNFAGPGPLR